MESKDTASAMEVDANEGSQAPIVAAANKVGIPLVLLDIFINSNTSANNTICGFL